MCGVVHSTYSVPLEESRNSLQEQLGMFSKLILRVFPPTEEHYHHHTCVLEESFAYASLSPTLQRMKTPLFCSPTTSSMTGSAEEILQFVADRSQSSRLTFYTVRTPAVASVRLYTAAEEDKHATSLVLALFCSLQNRVNSLNR